MLWFLLTAAWCQEDHTISILEKARYLPLAQRCEEAEKLIASDPKGAVQILDSILADPKLNWVECRLKIEVQRSLYKKYEFYPYQLRGRARMKVAEKAPPDEAKKLLKGAVDDLTTSFVTHRLASSKEYLEEARRKSGDDPEPAFSRKWNELLLKQRFVSARRHLESDGGFLPEEDRKKRLATLRKLSDECVRQAAADFLEGLENDGAKLEMPPKGEMLEANPRFDWCSDFAETARRMNEGVDVLDRLFDHAVAAIRLEHRDENRWFAAAEAVAYRTLCDRLRKGARDARGASEERAGTLLAEAELLRERWRDFEMRVIDAGGPTVARNLTPLLDEYPSTAALGAMLEKIRSSAEDSDPERRLEEAEGSLAKVAGAHGRTALTYRLVARVLRSLLAGKTEAETAQDLRWLAGELRQAGGAVEVNGFGPKVEVILRRLR